MEFKPLGAYVLLRQKSTDGKTKGGILIPDKAKKKLPVGEVLDLGPCVDFLRSEASVVTMAKDYAPPKRGDIVLYAEYTARDIPDSDGLVLVKDEDIICIVRGE